MLVTGKILNWIHLHLCLRLKPRCCALTIGIHCTTNRIVPRPNKRREFSA